MKLSRSNVITSACIAIGGGIMTTSLWIGLAVILIGLLFPLHDFLIRRNINLGDRQVVMLASVLLIANLALTVPRLTAIENYIYLYERYAEQWQGRYGDSINLTQEKRLRKQFSPATRYQFAPAVEIGKRGVVLTNVRLNFLLPNMLTVSTPLPKGWRRNFPGTDVTSYVVTIARIEHGGPVSVQESLLFHAQRVFHREVGYRITGTVHEGTKTGSFGPIDGVFTLELFE